MNELTCSSELKPTQVGLWLCSICGKIFNSTYGLEKHRRTNSTSTEHNNNSFCAKNADNIIYNTNTNLYSCKRCGYAVKNRSKLDRHLSRKTQCEPKLGNTKKDIPINGVMDNSSPKLDSSNSINCNSEQIIQSSPIKLIFEDEDKLYKCEKCNKIFNSKDHLNRHIQRQEPCVNAYSGLFQILITETENTNTKLNVLDLFCGCGGMSKGLTNAGLNVICGIDFWNTAIESYKENFDHLSLCADLTALSPDTLHAKLSDNYQINCIVDVIVGGPPCQGFSTMGNRDPKDPRNSLFMEFVKYVYYFLPKAFVMENVIGILSMKTEKGELVIDVILSYLSLSYNCEVYKLSASHYDVPQERKRVFIIGILKNINIQPTKPPESSKYNKIPIKSILVAEEDIDSKYYLNSSFDTKHKNYYGLHYLDLNKPCNTILAGYGKSGGYTSLIKYSDTKIRRLSLLEELVNICKHSGKSFMFWNKCNCSLIYTTYFRINYLLKDKSFVPEHKLFDFSFSFEKENKKNEIIFQSSL